VKISFVVWRLVPPSGSAFYKSPLRQPFGLPQEIREQQRTRPSNNDPRGVVEEAISCNSSAIFVLARAALTLGISGLQKSRTLLRPVSSAL